MRYSLVVIAIIAAGFCPLMAIALARSPFPDAHSLQPPPPDVRANISQNISGTAGSLPPLGSDDAAGGTRAPGAASAQLASQQNIAPTQPAGGTAGSSPSSLSTTLMYASLFLILGLLVYLIYREIASDSY